MRLRKGSRHSDLDGDGVSRFSEKRCEPNSVTVMGILAVALMAFSVLFSVTTVLRDPPADQMWSFADARVLEDSPNQGSKMSASHSIEAPEHKLLGGLLAAGFDEKHCISRYHSASYRKDSEFSPSPHLLSRLRNYESLHRRCGPYTESYNRSVQQLMSGQAVPSASDCNYLVWMPLGGLGNRILTLSSSFLYALLTDRVLLADPGAEMADLFCEPFPETTWILPLDFPAKNLFGSFNQKSPHCYGNLLKGGTMLNSTLPLVYLHLVHDYDDHDKLFFCEDEQRFLGQVPWLFLKSDNYFTPSLFLVPSFEPELGNLFPRSDTVFHFLGRYLFHPTNTVWGLITRYYEAYLARADERVGIQVRVFEVDPGPFQYVVDQILGCVMKEKLLPGTRSGEPGAMNPRSKAVLMTSLSPHYSKKLRDLYWEHPSETGEVVGVHQPSHEEYQQTEKKNHDRKAWAEMYLLSLMDVLVTSPWSTFGYVAQGLGGLRSWIMYKPVNRTVPDPSCQRAMSMEPCFHAPPFYDCKGRTGVDTGELVPHVRHCEDMSWGLKLVDSRDEM